jgi:4-alpha-glucanotransferase
VEVGGAAGEADLSRAPIAAALAELGIKRFVLAIHDVSFPSDPDEDIGRGAPTTNAAARLFAYARSLGFTGVQLGPQGQTSRDNPSPYDSTIFSRHLATIAVSSFRAGGQYAGLVDEAALDGLLTSGPVDHRHAYDASRALVAAAFDRLEDHPAVVQRFATFMAAHQDDWLGRDAMYAAYSQSFGGAGYRDWPDELARLWHPRPAPGSKLDVENREFMLRNARDVMRYAFGQFLAHEEHARVRTMAGLALYSDLQVGYSDGDAWVYRAAFLDDYVMGAPPSRTNPEGQPWNYPVLDPDQLGDGAARTLLLARIDKAFAEYDSIRIDHPHGLVCPWVYRAHSDDPGQAVRDGARLYESPALPDHPALARYAIARDDQIDHALPRHHDRWVRDLDDTQVARYARLFDLFADCATRHGRAMADVSCEVLSTLPVPLERVLERHGLGRWRVTQKANLDDATDVYRSENAKQHDWIMLGNHDTAPIFALIRAWSVEQRAGWARHLSARLALTDAPFDDDGFVATAMLAELFACAAENVSIFFADLFGETARFNAPGTISDANWSLRLPPDFARVHHDRLDRHAALDLRLALALALDARGSTSGLAARLRTR